MGRRVLAGVAAAAAILLLALAASSGPVRVWSVPEDRDEAPEVTVATRTLDAPPTTVVVPVDEGERLPFDSAIINVIAVMLAMLVLAALVVSFRLLHDVKLPQLFGRRRRRVIRVEALPEFADPPLVVDAVAARAALAEGDPRNAIVACWMRLERDAADAGLARDPAETSLEYVDRVVRAASVDPGPIAALGALYREARFSRHELTTEHRTRAADALDRVLAALPARAEVEA